MTASEPTRLVGSDEDIVLLAERARVVIAEDRELAARVIPAASGLGRARREFASTRPAAGEQRKSAGPPDRTASVRGVIWAVVFGVGLVAAVVSAAVMYPPLRRITLEPSIAVPLMTVSTVVAVVALAAALILRAAPGQAGVGAILCAIVAVSVLIAVGYRLVVGVSGGTQYEPSQLAWWFVGAVVILVILVFLAVRLRRQSHRTDQEHGVNLRGDRVSRTEVRRLRAYAAQLADAEPATPEGRQVLAQSWRDDLQARPDLASETTAQALAIGPVAWLVWASFDGGIDESRVSL